MWKYIYVCGVEFTRPHSNAFLIKIGTNLESTYDTLCNFLTIWLILTDKIVSIKTSLLKKT